LWQATALQPFFDFFSLSHFHYRSRRIIKNSGYMYVWEWGVCERQHIQWCVHFRRRGDRSTHMHVQPEVGENNSALHLVACYP
jgi:hypothetical protein